jgi:hypothetical protein
MFEVQGWGELIELGTWNFERVSAPERAIAPLDGFIISQITKDTPVRDDSRRVF